MSDGDLKLSDGSAAASAKRSAKGDVERVELGKRELAVARRTAEAKAVVPHIYLRDRVELPGAEDGPSAGSIVAAVGRALRLVPALNASYRDGGIERFGRINIGVVTETDSGAVVPAILDADTKSAEEVGSELGSLRAAACAGELTSPSLAGVTFTLTLLEEAAVLLPTVSSGQAAHLAVAAPRAAAQITEDGEIVAGMTLELGLSCDGRAVRASQASDFLARTRAAIPSASEYKA